MVLAFFKIYKYNKNLLLLQECNTNIIVNTYTQMMQGMK